MTMQIHALVLAVLTLLLASASGAQEPGDIYVIDDLSGTDFRLFSIDPASGDRTLVSGCEGSGESCASLRGSGPVFGSPRGLAVEDDGSIVIADDAIPRDLLRVDPSNGNRTLIEVTNGLPDAENFGALRDVAIDADGRLRVVDRGQATPGLLRVLRIDQSGTSVVTDSTGVGSGPAASPSALAILRSAGTIFVAGDDEAQSPESRLLDVDPDTGGRSILAGLSLWNRFRGVALASDGHPLVTAKGGLIRVNPITGIDQTLSSELLGQGPELTVPEHVAVENSGAVLVVQRHATSHVGIIRVNPETGTRTALDGSGPSFLNPYGIDVVPEVCGDLNGDGFADRADVTRFREFLADPLGNPLSAFEQQSCGTAPAIGSCGIVDVAVLLREAELPFSAPGIAQLCSRAGG